MRNYSISIIIIFLISFTTFIKNSSKNLENEIYNKKESIELLSNKYDLILLENNYLTAPKKLFGYDKALDLNDYITIDITDLNKIYLFNRTFSFERFTLNE